MSTVTEPKVATVTITVLSIELSYEMPDLWTFVGTEEAAMPLILATIRKFAQEQDVDVTGVDDDDLIERVTEAEPGWVIQVSQLEAPVVANTQDALNEARDFHHAVFATLTTRREQVPA